MENITITESELKNYVKYISKDVLMVHVLNILNEKGDNQKITYIKIFTRFNKSFYFCGKRGSIYD